MDKNDKLYYHFYGTVLGLDGDTKNSTEPLKKVVGQNFGYYPGKMQQYVAPFNHAGMIDKKIIMRRDSIRKEWAKNIRNNGASSDSSVLDAMDSQRKELFLNVIMPMSAQIISFVKNPSDVEDMELLAAFASLLSSINGDDEESLKTHILKMLHVLFISPSINNFKALNNLIGKWVKQYLRTEYKGIRGFGQWRRCFIGYEVLAFTAYQLSEASTKSSIKEANKEMFPYAPSVDYDGMPRVNLLKCISEKVNNSIKQEIKDNKKDKKKKTKEELSKKDKLFEQPYIEKEDTHKVICDYWDELKGDPFTSLSIHSKISYSKKDKVNGRKKITENEKISSGCISICQKYNTVYEVNSKEFFFNKKYFAGNSLYLDQVEKALSKLHTIFSCSEGHGARLVTEKYDKRYCHTSAGSTPPNKIDSKRYLHWGEDYKNFVFVTLGIEDDLSPEIQLPISIFLSPLPIEQSESKKGQPEKKQTRLMMEQCLRFLSDFLKDDEDYSLMYFQANHTFSHDLSEALKQTILAEDTDMCSEVI